MQMLNWLWHNQTKTALKMLIQILCKFVKKPKRQGRQLIVNPTWFAKQASQVAMLTHLRDHYSSRAYSDDRVSVQQDRQKYTEITSLQCVINTMLQMESCMPQMCLIKIFIKI